MKPHFFKARSRIGLVNPPLGSIEPNIGVEKAPDAILSESFLVDIGQYEISQYNFLPPEAIEKELFFKVLQEELSEFKSLINKNLKVGERQVVIGGDDSVTFSSLMASLERKGGSRNFGYLRFDSHADMNLYASSPTKNFHGMYHRPLFGNFDISEISELVPIKIPAENVLFIGNLNLDYEEEIFFKDKKFRNIKKEDLENWSRAEREITDFVKSFEFLHVSFDIDCLDRSIAAATGIPAKNGLTLDEVLKIARLVLRTLNYSFDLVEVNPNKQEAEQTVKVAQDIIKFFL